MNRSAHLRYVGTGVPALALTIIFLVVLPGALRSRRERLAVEIVRIAPDPTGSGSAVVRLTNQTRWGFNYAFWTEVLSKGVWTDAAAQHREARTHL